MAMTRLGLGLLHSALTQGFPGMTGLRIVSLGFPDMLTSVEDIRQYFGDAVVDKLAYREDSKDILKWHGAQWLDRVVDTHSFFNALGHHLDCIDHKEVRGGEIVHDLNQPLPEALHGRYDILFDPGTIEHCFNVAEAMRSIAKLVRVGGYVIQGVGLNYYNHGFYNFSPTFVVDFFGQNGFELMWAEGLNQRNHGREVTKFEFDWVRSFNLPASATSASIYYIVKRRSLQKIIWPTQGKYLKHPGVKG